MLKTSSDNSNGKTSKHDALINRRQTCLFFSKNSWCKFGKRCRYSHEDPIETDPGSHALNVEDESTEQNGSLNVEIASRSETTGLAGIKDQSQKRICKFFAQNGFCKFGTSCKFLHGNGGESSAKAEPVAISLNEKQLCKYFDRTGRCRFGIRCRYVHAGEYGNEASNNLALQEQGQEFGRQHAAKHPSRSFLEECAREPVVAGDLSRSEASAPRVQKRPEPVRPQSIYKLEKLSETELVKLRASELNCLRKLYPKSEEITLPNGTHGYLVKFLPSDPDWPYDVKELPLIVSFPPNYPCEMLVVKIQDSSLPDLVKRVVGADIRDWLAVRHGKIQVRGEVELVLKPFFHWLDHSLEDLFTEGLSMYQRQLMAQAAGFEFVTASQLQEKYGQGSCSEEETCSEGNGSDVSEEEEEDSEEEEWPSRPLVFEEERRGTEMKAVQLQLKEFAAVLQLYQAKLVLNCGRCRQSCTLSLVAKQLCSVECSKCHCNMLVSLRPVLTHQYSSILGYLDIEGCTPHDVLLMDCHFFLQCLNCDQEQKLQGIQPGQLMNTWCQHCHKKMAVSMETVKFQQLQPSVQLDASQAGVVVKSKTQRTLKDPAIQLGHPLPANGTCKHYKKSFRWLRFPCCGMAYPCDICHDEGEDGHEMKYANRMICGFCCREQPYSVERPCVACDSNMVKKATVHWEGGKGCRDKIKMSRDDIKKYANMNKTVSRKQSAKLQGKKKTLKLRHK